MTVAYDYRLNAHRRAVGRPIEYPPPALVAGLFGDRQFKEWLHPRDRMGRWIEKFGRVKLFNRMSSKVDGAGQVERLNRDGTVSVRVTTGMNSGKVVRASPDELEASDAKAILNTIPTPPTPEAVKPARRPWAPRRPAFTGAAAELAQGKTYEQLAAELDQRPIVTFDYETTGIDVNGEDRGVEVAAVRMIGDRVVDRFYSRMNPMRPIHPKASEVNGIYDADVADEPPHHAVAQQLRDYIGDDIVSAHNAQFDLDALKASLRDSGDADWEPSGVIDTVALARDTMPDRKKDPNGVVADHKLGTLATFFDIQLAKAHSAEHDTQATAHLLRSVLAYASRTGASPADMRALTDKWHSELGDYRTKLDEWKRATSGPS